MLGELAEGDDVGDGEAAAGPQHAKRPRNTRGLSGLRLMTQLLMTASTVASPQGRFSISPRRNSRREAGSWRRSRLRARESMSGVMSTPMTLPPLADGVAREEAVDAGAAPEVERGLPGLERGEADGVPHPTPRSASPAAARSAAEYPMAERFGVEETQHDPDALATSA